MSDSSSALAAVRPSPIPIPTTEDLAREIRAVRNLLDLHVREHESDRRIAQTRHEAVMGILKDLLTRLPDV